MIFAILNKIGEETQGPSAEDMMQAKATIEELQKSVQVETLNCFTDLFLLYQRRDS